jgi:ketosteroid isomerase-like protein
MSQGNVEIVKASLEAINRGDWDAVIEVVAPDAELDMSRAVGPDVGGGVLSRDQWRRFVAEFAENWESLWFEADEFIEAGDLVVVPLTTHVRGRDGIEASARATWVHTIRDGAIQRTVMYQEREDALEAVGLSEQDAHTDSS